MGIILCKASVNFARINQLSRSYEVQPEFRKVIKLCYLKQISILHKSEVFLSNIEIDKGEHLSSVYSATGTNGSGGFLVEGDVFQKVDFGVLPSILLPNVSCN